MTYNAMAIMEQRLKRANIDAGTAEAHSLQRAMLWASQGWGVEDHYPHQYGVGR